MFYYNVSVYHGGQKPFSLTAGSQEEAGSTTDRPAAKYISNIYKKKTLEIMGVAAGRTETETETGVQLHCNGAHVRQNRKYLHFIRYLSDCSDSCSGARPVKQLQGQKCNCLCVCFFLTE